VSNRKGLSLKEIQARLEVLMERRTLKGLSASEETEFRELIGWEALALTDRGDFGQL